MIAALFVAKGGCYFGMPNVDPWDESRDARLYAGPWPVVAHPPCQRWGSLAFANHARWGGEHNRPGNDGGCFLTALTNVRTYGGVLEHPAHSRAWGHFDLTVPPPEGGWRMARTNEWTCEIWQSAYGHRAQKRTWLYVCSTSKPADLDWSHPEGTHQIGFQDQRGKARNKPTLSKLESSATPIALRDALISIAESATIPS